MAAFLQLIAKRHPDNRIAGEVIDSAYRGRCWRLQLKVGQDIVRIDWPKREINCTRVEFSLPPERCTVLTA